MKTTLTEAATASGQIFIRLSTNHLLIPRKILSTMMTMGMMQT